MRLRVAACAATTALGLILGNAALAQDTVTFWQFSTREADITAWNEAIAAFEAQNPDVEGSGDRALGGAAAAFVDERLTTGGLPDVSMLGNNVVAQFQAIGALAPLDEYSRRMARSTAMTWRRTPGRGTRAITTSRTTGGLRR